MTYSYTTDSCLVSIPSDFQRLSVSEQEIHYCRFNFDYEYEMRLTEGLIDRCVLWGPVGRCAAIKAPAGLPLPSKMTRTHTYTAMTKWQIVSNKVGISLLAQQCFLLTCAAVTRRVMRLSPGSPAVA